MSVARCVPSKPDSRKENADMPLDLERLQMVKQRPGKIIAQCPACAETGGDGDGTHLAVFDDGRFACIKFQGDKEHRRRIFALVGLPADKPVFHTELAPRPPKEALAPIDWREDCARLAGNSLALKRLAIWRGWTPEYCHALAVAEIIGIFKERIAFPVANASGTVIADIALHGQKAPAQRHGIHRAGICC